jgi:hypothetical protein
MSILMNNETFRKITKDVLEKEYGFLDCDIFRDAQDRRTFDDEANSVVIRITDSGARYYLCLLVTEEYRGDTPSSQLESNVRSFIKKVVSQFTPENYQAPKDGRACELWVLGSNGIMRK